jgi:DNA-binding NarL/FixJ family response regulator
MTAKKIIIVEDNNLFREGLKSLLSTHGGFEIVGEARDGLEAVRCITKQQPDLVLLDLSMPKMDGISVIRRIKSQIPNIKIMALTNHSAEKYVLGVFEAGAEGYCLKDACRSELLLAVGSVLEGRRYISPTISHNVLEGYLSEKKQMKPKSDFDTLSQRERDVLKMLAEGYQNKEIASMLCISVKTVEKHRANIMAKLGLHSASLLTAYAMEHGLITKEK